MPRVSDVELTALLFTHDDTALMCLVDTYAFDLVSILSKKYKMEYEEVWDVVIDALIALTQNPKKYNADKSSLKTFINMDVEGDLLNQLKKNKRNPLKIETEDPVELEINHGNKDVEELTDVDYEGFADQIKGFFAMLFDADVDREIAWMMEIDGVRETAAFSKLLSLQDIDSDSQQLIVKRHKDRIKVKLERQGWTAFKKSLKKHFE